MLTTEEHNSEENKPALTRKSKGSEAIRRESAVDLESIKADMAAIKVCGKSKGFMTKCPNHGHCKGAWKDDANSLELICAVAKLRHDLFPENGGVQVLRLQDFVPSCM